MQYASIDIDSEEELFYLEFISTQIRMTNDSFALGKT